MDVDIDLKVHEYVHVFIFVRDYDSNVRINQCKLHSLKSCEVPYVHINAYSNLDNCFEHAVYYDTIRVLK